MTRPAGALESWDAFAAQCGAFSQMSPWADVKRSNGWRPLRVMSEHDGNRIGAQVLVKPVAPRLWSVGYAPRGPIATSFSAAAVVGFTEELRRLGRSGAGWLSHVTVDPEVEAGGELEALLRAAGWRRGRAIQPDRTRLVDLARSEEEVWGDLRSKWRQYVQKARRAGVVVTESGREGLDDFYRIQVETARRAGFLHRSRSAYGEVYDAYARIGAARLLFARGRDGEPLATLMLITCGPKVIEPYGGMTAAGAETRANYLLKWEAIRTSREAGFCVYDMWGLATPGIERFKSGFGGREVRYVGAWDLVTSRPLRAATDIAQRFRIALARHRYGVPAGGAGGEQE